MNKFSIILPVRNGGEYVRDCVNSVLGQSYPHFNFIVLDNCSTDGTREWILSIKDERIILIESEKSLSIVENWSRVKDVEKNEFMTIIGHDDILNSDYLTVMDELISSFPEAGLYQTHYNFIDGKGSVIRPCVPMKAVISPIEFFEAILKNSIEIIGTGFIVRSKDYDYLGGIPDYPNLLYADIEIWLKIITDKYMAVSNKNCFSFRFHIENTSKSSGIFRLEAFERMVKYFKKYTLEHPKYQASLNTYGRSFLKSYVIGSCHKLLYIPKENRNSVTMDRIIISAKVCAELLLGNIQFEPANFRSVRLAKLVDRVAIFRKFFLFYKSFFKRTF